MNFLKRHWKGIVLFVLAGLIVFLTCHFTLGPELKYTKIGLPIFVDIFLFMLSYFVKLDYKKWPWHLNRKEWQKIWAEISRRSCT